MTGSVEEVLQQLRAVIGALDRAAVIAMGAQAEADRAYSSYTEAATGSAHPQLNVARQESRIAADKAGKVVRLLAEAATSFAEYVNAIAPDTVPTRASAPEAMPAGESLAETSGEGALSSMLLGRIDGVPNGDDGLEHMHSLADNVQDAARPGGHAVHRPSMSVYKGPIPRGHTRGTSFSPR